MPVACVKRTEKESDTESLYVPVDSNRQLDVLVQNHAHAHALCSLFRQQAIQPVLLVLARWPPQVDLRA